MKSTSHLAAIALSFISFPLLTGCVNSFGDEDDSTTDGAGDVAITFTASVGSAATRVTDNTFDSGDEISLFAMITGADLTGRRYIDNLKLTAASDGSTLTPETTVFYPDGSSTLDFVAFYPYQSDGIDDGSSTLGVSVKTDQSSDENLSLSDFLVATTNSVSASSDAVSLAFAHKLARVNIELVPSDGLTVSALLSSAPTIKAGGFYTAADYDFLTDSYTNLTSAATITLGGSWEEGTDALTGLQMIVIPQTMSSSSQYFTLELDGHYYTCTLEDPVTLASGTATTIQFSVSEVADDILNGTVASITDWDDGDTITGSSSGEISFIDINSLSFSSSEVYRVYLDGYAVAEICREYLNNSSVSARAIVAYPVDEDDETDLSQGTVLQLLDTDGSVHGGTANWTDEYTFSYTAGTSSAIEKIYIDNNGNILISQPTSAATVSVKSYMLTDVRGSETEKYGIVKIGTNYWTRENLRTTAYTDGTALTVLTSASDEPGYYVEDEEYYYNGYLFEQDDYSIVPSGWYVPSYSEWEELVAYTDGLAALKSGEWSVSSSSTETTVAEVTNLTGFTALPAGVWVSKFTSSGSIASFMAIDADGEVETYLPAFLGQSDELSSATSVSSATTYYKGVSVRFMRE